MMGGYIDEASAWRDWLLRAAAGAPTQMQIMYGVAGARRLTEFDLPWLPGYEGSKPVRIGNAASGQFQLDVYGETANSLFLPRQHGLTAESDAWPVGRALAEFVEQIWQRPDDGIWEVRGGRRHFTHSKLMAWVAVDRIVKIIETSATAANRACACCLTCKGCESGFGRSFATAASTRAWTRSPSRTAATRSTRACC